MISRKLIAPITGAVVVQCAVGLAVAADASGPDSPTGTVPSSGQSIIVSHVARTSVLLGGEVSITGSLPTGSSESLATLQKRVRHGWADLDQASAQTAGQFTLDFRPRQVGALELRVQVAGTDGPSDSLTSTVEVFHRVLVSWYAPVGLTACGQQLTPTTLGVASKTLPCGTLVTLRYDGRSLRVPVIDRGPYVAGRDYDLTWATKVRLHAHDLTEVWANH